MLSLLVGVALYDAGAVSIGTVFLLFQSIQLVRASLEVIADQLRTLQQAGAGATRVAELFDLESSVVDGPVGALPAGALAVAFDDVTFRYGDGLPALDHVSFAVPPVASSGSSDAPGAGRAPWRACSCASTTRRTAWFASALRTCVR